MTRTTTVKVGGMQEIRVHILTLMLVWATVRQKPGPPRPAQWIAVYDGFRR
ncbi:hypothetical protein [Streptomyces sp. NPDC088178]|uniref:hypothetical protein n=1 Tax=Streptomyces sp. NPDC088178 TaxID=3365836 RepID=UPI00380DB634